MVEHGGNQPGATSMLYQLPSRGIAVIILTNLEGKGQEVTALAEAIAADIPRETQEVERRPVGIERIGL